jgi:hypothetical protein
MPCLVQVVSRTSVFMATALADTGKGAQQEDLNLLQDYFWRVVRLGL